MSMPEDSKEKESNPLLSSQNITTPPLWLTLRKNIFTGEEYNNEIYSKLELNYVKQKANKVYNKIFQIAQEENQPIKDLIQIYIEEMQRGIENIKKEQFINTRLQMLSNNKIKNNGNNRFFHQRNYQ